MWTRYRRKTNKSSFIVSFLLLLIGYFSYHLYYGNYGVHAHRELKEQIIMAEQSLQEMQAARSALQAKIARLQEGSLDLDLLDEYMRSNFNVSRKNELTILTKP